MILLDVIKDLLTSFIAKIYVNKNIWIISERGTDARDNGFSFFKYLKNEHPDINTIFVINPNSADYKKVSSLGKTVKPNSLMHGIYYYAASFIIGTHPGCGQPKWRGMHALENLNLAVPIGKRVFLQHGITKDFFIGLTSSMLKTNLFICGAKPEYDFIKDNFGFDEDVVKYTGFARFDNLNKYKKEKSKTILLMPTWRVYLSKISQEEFLNSDYFIRYNQILNSQLFNKMLETNGYKLLFYPHYEIQKWIHLFSKNSPNIIIADFDNYDVQELLISCDLLITDYSSVFFDIAYMNKQTIYYQFDYDLYRKTQYSEGYFDYNNAFGPVVYSLEDLIKTLTDFFQNGVREKYLSNMRQYFVYQDEDNCNRIYNEIKKLR